MASESIRSKTPLETCSAPIVHPFVKSWPTILGIFVILGAVATAASGLAGYVGAIRSLSHVQAIILMATGGYVALILTIVLICCSRRQKTHVEDNRDQKKENNTTTKKRTIQAPNLAKPEVVKKNRGTEVKEKKGGAKVEKENPKVEKGEIKPSNASERPFFSFSMPSLLYMAASEPDKKESQKPWVEKLPEKAFERALIDYNPRGVGMRNREKIETKEGKNWGSVIIPNLRTEESGCFSTWKVVEDVDIVFSFECNNLPVAVYGVCDGHGDQGCWSRCVSDFFRTEIPKRLSKLEELSPETIRMMLVQLCLDCEESIPYVNGGTTVSCALDVGDKIYIFNVGDSRTCIVQPKEKRCLQLTQDASPDVPRFKEEILKKGHTVSEDGYVMPIACNMARDIGLKELSAEPDVVVIEKNQKTFIPESSSQAEKTKIGYQTGDYLILATDGLWDVCTRSDLQNTVSECVKLRKKPSEIALELGLRARMSKSHDDITVVVVKIT